MSYWRQPVDMLFVVLKGTGNGQEEELTIDSIWPIRQLAEARATYVLRDGIRAVAVQEHYLDGPEE